MKNPDIQQMLERYREGTLSDGELAELNRLTHRDEVMAEAGSRAAGIIRRRRATLFSAAGLLVAGATMWTLLSPRSNEAPMIAETSVPEVVILDTPEPTVEQAAPATPAVKPRTAPKATVARRPAVKPSEEPVVVCNNQCEADSVISDIWKFLTV